MDCFVLMLIRKLEWPTSSVHTAYGNQWHAVRMPLTKERIKVKDKKLISVQDVCCPKVCIFLFSGAQPMGIFCFLMIECPVFFFCFIFLWFLLVKKV